MSSIPLPALAVKTPEQPDPLQNYGRLMQMKNMAQQQQLGQVDLQEKQQALKDRDGLTKAFIEANGDPDKTLTLAGKYGVSYNGLQSAKETALKQKQTLATLDKDRLANIKSQNDLIGQQAGSILALPPEQRPAAIQQSLPDLVQKLGQPPEAAQQMLSQIPLNDPKQLEQWLKVHQINAQSTNEQIDNHFKEQKAQEDAAEAARKAAMAPSELQKSQNEAANPPMSEAGLFLKAAGGDPMAAVKLQTQQKIASRPVNNIMTRNDASDIADAIESGDQPPTLQGLYRNAGPVRAELARRGVPLAKMETDWKATQKYLGTLNGTQQTRLRQSISSASDFADKIDGLYQEWQKIAPTSGFKVLNKASLMAMKQLPGRAGAVATALDAQIADLTSDLGNVYMGGNSPTDHSLALAGRNLSADWNQQTFEEGLKQIHSNLKIRQNSITHAMPAGVGGEYMPAGQGAPQGGGNDFFGKFGGTAR